MNLYELQAHLIETGRYHDTHDGLWGKNTRNAIIQMLEDGPDTPINDNDLLAMANRNALSFAQVKAVLKVEANGAGFEKGFPKILPEPHRFSKATNHKFDALNPTVSYPKWGTRPYPKTQEGRYDVLLSMIRLDIDAGFGSASYGKPQIMGENFKLAGYSSPVFFAEAMARDEATQLKAFETFLNKAGLMGKLRACTGHPATCRPFCAGYNGSAFDKNQYDIKLAAAIREYS